MVKKFRLCAVWLAYTAWLCTIPGLLRAEIYSYRDESGKIHLANRPSGRIVPLKKTPVPGSSHGFGQATAGGAFSSAGSRYDNLIRRAADYHNVSFGLIKAVIHAESAFNPRAASRKGALGLMQLMPGTAREMGVREVFNPEQNILGGTRYLKRMLEIYNEDLRLSLAAYNAGPAAVDRNGGVPPFPETRRFIHKVLGLMRAYEAADSRSGGKLYHVIKNGIVMLTNRPLP